MSEFLQSTRAFWIAIALVAFLVPTVLGVGSVRAERENGDRRVQAVIDESTKEHDLNQGLTGRIVTLEGEVATLKKQNESLNIQLARAAEASRAAQVRASRSRRITAVTTPQAAQTDEPTGDWAHSVRGIKTANCESADLQNWPYSDGTRYLGGYKGIHLRDSNGHYGKWQFAVGTWAGVGGSGNPADASEAEQDYRANLLYAQSKKETGSGERPWTCARKV